MTTTWTCSRIWIINFKSNNSESNEAQSFDRYCHSTRAYMTLKCFSVLLKRSAEQTLLCPWVSRRHPYVGLRPGLLHSSQLHADTASPVSQTVPAAEILAQRWKQRPQSRRGKKQISAPPSKTLSMKTFIIKMFSRSVSVNNVALGLALIL